ncbi:MAG: U32 family peptidase, partial [Treponemataceae bacterium]|nr:U32 family peptidase [Treponemataceae bacterium]
AIDALQGKISPEEAAPYIQELYKAPHREFGTGFFFRHEDADKTTVGESASEFELAATIGKELSREEASALQEKAQKAREEFDAELATMHPDAKKAKEKDLELHPEKVPHPLTKDDIKDAKLFVCSPLNRIDSKTWCEFVGPNNTGIQDSDFVFVDSETGMIMDWTSHNHDCLLLTKKDIAENWIMRTKSQNKLSGTNKR